MRDFRPSVRRYSFGNPRGNVGKHGDLQFDSKGVEFGPWVRRFQAQVYRNWFLPYRVLTDSGHVVLTFNVHRDGSLTDVQVLRPDIDPFNHSASNALLMSNPDPPAPRRVPRRDPADHRHLLLRRGRARRPSVRRRSRSAAC